MFQENIADYTQAVAPIGVGAQVASVMVGKKRVYDDDEETSIFLAPRLRKGHIPPHLR